MTICKLVTLTADPQNLVTLLGIQEEMRGKMSLILQAASGNGGPVLYGSKAAQLMELAAGAQEDHIEEVNGKDIYFRGAGLVLRIFVVQG